MREAIAKKWIKALRSGQYKQCQGSLSEENEEGRSYCCLGVLCEVTNTGYVWTDGELPRAATLKTGMKSTYGTLPEEIQKEVEEPNLVELNDGGWDFNRIADIIERCYIKL
jgi:hypothetical protein